MIYVDSTDLPNRKMWLSLFLQKTAGFPEGISWLWQHVPCQVLRKISHPNIATQLHPDLLGRGEAWHRIGPGTFPGPQEEYSSLLPSAGVTTRKADGNFLLFSPALWNSVCYFAVDCGIVCFEMSSWHPHSLWEPQICPFGAWMAPLVKGKEQQVKCWTN